MKRTIIRHVGTAFIVLSLAGFLFLAFPLLRAYLFPPEVTVTASPSVEFILTIPTIRAQSRVIEQVNPFDAAVYNEKLKQGVAHADGTGLPGSGKTVFLFAHSSGTPWEQVYTNTLFLRLHELQEGDEIVIDRKKQRFLYRVEKKLEVTPDRVEYIQNIDKDQLILQTCTPIGTSLRRLLVFAVPIR